MMEVSDEFVKQIDESIREEMGVGLDELLNPAFTLALICLAFLSSRQLLGIPIVAVLFNGLAFEIGFVVCVRGATGSKSTVEGIVG